MENLKIKVEYGTDGFKLELDGNMESVREEFRKIKDEGLGRIMGNVDFKFETATEVSPGHLFLHGKDVKQISENGFPAIMDVVMKNKAKSEVEWMTVYAFYATEYGQKSFNRNSILEYYEKTKRNSKSNISNISANFKSTISKDYLQYLNDEELIITPKGIEKAKEIVSREPGAYTTHTVSNKPSNGKAKNTSANSAPKLLGELNLRPDGKESLTDFYNRYDAKTYMEKNLLFCYYLSRVADVASLGLNHIYTCYKALGERVPGNLYQSLADTKNRYAWIDTKDTSDIRLTQRGETYVEHDMPKK